MRFGFWFAGLRSGVLVPVSGAAWRAQPSKARTTCTLYLERGGGLASLEPTISRYYDTAGGARD